MPSRTARKRGKALDHSSRGALPMTRMAVLPLPKRSHCTTVTGVLALPVTASIRVSKPGEPSIRIGSRDENDVVVRDEAVSRLHATIDVDDLGYRLRDLESTNGTFVDGMRVRDCYLGPGAVVGIGHATLAFAPLDRENDVPAAGADRFGPLVGKSVAMRELYALLERGHHDVKLPPEDLSRITLWLDSNSNFFGAYHDPEEQARGELIQPIHGVPAWTDFSRIAR